MSVSFELKDYVPMIKSGSATDLAIKYVATANKDTAQYTDTMNTWAHPSNFLVIQQSKVFKDQGLKFEIEVSDDNSTWVTMDTAKLNTSYEVDTIATSLKLKNGIISKANLDGTRFIWFHQTWDNLQLDAKYKYFRYKVTPSDNNILGLLMQVYAFDRDYSYPTQGHFFN